MTWFERLYCILEPVMPVHYVKVRRLLRCFCPDDRRPRRVLDVGGRKSPYTIGVNCNVEIVDLPRESEIQKTLSLGLTEQMLSQLRAKRSNITSIRLEDITQTTYDAELFDLVVSVEVIEHVPDDSAYVRQIHRVLKSGGCFVLTTPNGQTKPNTNPDHIRHYTRAALEEKLKEAFDDVTVFYGVRQGFVHDHAIRGWVPSRNDPVSWLRMPWRMMLGLLANLLEGDSASLADRTNQLFGVARKSMSADHSKSIPG